MKNNKKNRKLNFIRVKNNLRLGRVKFYFSRKISSSITPTDIVYKDIVEQAIKQLSNKYNLTLRHISIGFKWIDDDFEKDLYTAVVTIHN